MFSRWLNIPSDKSCLLIGHRRSGKTTLLRELFPDLNYTTLDDLDYLDWAQQDPKGFVQSLGKSGIIDEIQHVPKLTIAVKHAIDQRNAKIFMTGSSTIGLLDAAADTMAGRIDILSLPALCWGEDLSTPTHEIFKEKANPVQLRQGKRLLDKTLIFGGFPEVAEQKTEEQKKKILIRYKNTYFTRDLMQLSNLENLEGLLGIFHNLVRSLGSHLEVSNFARESGVSHPTAKKYLNALNQAQLTFQLRGYHFGPAKRFIKATKTYFADNGIIYSLNNRTEQGALLENFVISELEKRRKLGYLPTDEFYYYKSASGHEIDLIFETRDSLYAIEIKSSRHPGRSDITNLMSFMPKKDLKVKRFLFYLGDEYKTVEDVRLIPVAALFRGR
ncbi:MAG: ATP-binding protein [Desulfonatronovibrio sp.]